MVKDGQLVREHHAADGVHIIEFGSYSGSVIVFKNWGGANTTMTVPKVQTGPWKTILHEVHPIN